MDNMKNMELEMFNFFEKTPVMVCIAGRDGYFRKVNPAFIKKMGFSEKEILAKPINALIYKNDLEVTGREREKLFKGETMINFQNRYVTKEGKVIWIEWNSIYFPERELVFAIAKDVSEQKKAEMEIEEKYKKFKSLATHFKASIEEDRKYLAIELHEELAQLAAVVKMDVDDVLKGTANLPDTSVQRLEHASTIANLLINTIQRISFSISPNMIEDIGLNETIKWHCREFELLNGIYCRFEAAYDEEILTREIQLDFFRICQEALSNVMYHAQANNVKVSIEDSGEAIVLTITDDGKGFDNKKNRENSGLISIRERAASINGRLMIHSETGRGTRIRVTVSKP